MRILLVTQYFLPAWDYGGPVGKITAISRELAKRGHDVEVLTSGSLSNGSGERAGPGSVRLDGVLVHYLSPLFVYRGVSINLGAVAFCRRELARFDIVHIFGLYDWLGTVAYRAAHARGVAYVVEPLGMYVPAERGFFRKWLYRRLVGNDMLRGAQKVIATSDVEFEQLRGSGVVASGNLTVRRNGIDLTEFSAEARGRARERYGLTADDRVVLFLGRVAPIKQLELLVEAFSRLEVERAHLLIVGPRPDREYARKLRELCDTMPGRERVHFCDAVQARDRAELLADADVVVLTSRTESFGNAVAEAIATGVPVVVTEGCGVAPLVRGRVGLVTSHSALEVRNALARMLTDRTMYQSFKANCQAVRQEFAWDGAIALLESVYAEAVGQFRRV